MIKSLRERPWSNINTVWVAMLVGGMVGRWFTIFEWQFYAIIIPVIVVAQIVQSMVILESHRLVIKALEARDKDG